MSWVLYALLSAILSSLAAIVEKKTLIREHASEFATLLALGNLIVSIPLFFLIDYNNINGNVLALIYVVSVVASFAFLFVTKCVRHMEISVVSPLLVLGPALTALLAFIVLDEQLRWWQTAGIVLLVIGAYILQTKAHLRFIDPIKQFFSSKYTWFLLAALFLYAISANFDRFILTRFTIQPLEYIAFFHLFAAINLFFLHALLYDGYTGLVKGAKLFGGPIFLIACCTVGYRFFQAQAVSMIAVGLAISVKRLSILFTTVIGGRLFHEEGIARKAGACVIMLVGAMLIIL